MNIYFQPSKKRLLAALIIVSLMFSVIVFSGFIEKSAKGEYQTEEFVATEILGSDAPMTQDDDLPQWFYDELFNPYEVGASEIRCQQDGHVVGFTVMASNIASNMQSDENQISSGATNANSDTSDSNKTQPKASQVNSKIVQAMKANDWVLFDSGNDSCQTMRKAHGQKTWAYIACVQLDNSVSVVMTID